MGCKGPTTYNACSVTKWNGNLSYPIQSGHGCIGCSEKDFWDNGPFYQHLGKFPGFGIESTADTVGATAGVAAVGAIALHGITSSIRKRKVREENLGISEIPNRQDDPVDVVDPKSGGDAS